MTVSALHVFVALGGLLVLSVVKRVLTRSGVTRQIRGPTANSFVLGNFLEYFRDEVGAHEFKWQEEYGAVYRIKGLFGEDRLVIADPKALQYMYQSAGTNFLKPTLRREFGRMYIGRGIAWAQGDDHKRHRKIMSPAFTKMESRAMIPVFRATADRMCRHWESIISGSESTGSKSSEGCIDVANWLSRAALDALGDVAFNYRFGTLDNSDNRLAKAHHGLLVEAFGLPSPGKIFAQQALVYMPLAVFKIIEKLPSRSLRGLRNVAYEGNRVAKELVDQKMEDLKAGVEEPKLDIMSLLVQANLSEDPSSKLSEEELLSEMRTIMVAGHETSGSTMAFLLYELAKHPHAQTNVRAEISEREQAARSQGRSELSMADLESMSYSLAVIKETLRLHPVVYGPFVECAQDDVLPLAKPIRTVDGTLLSELPVKKGQFLNVSISGYNRLADIWGPDPHVFRPDRWLDGSLSDISSPFGVYANLGNFVSGAIACLGWRFALVEMQTFLVEIVRRFQIAYPSDAPPMIRATSGVMAPVLAGEIEKGKQLRLNLTLI